ncbi:hypothetical protein HF285_01040 [Acidithiobacillus ferrooxidans F221]|nr:hypothetical protein [Acidithiobacillus ferrooxidans]MBU2806904.1 hypothetical protein [Acidithiobacillus ferrooxidans F221]
MKVCAYGLTVNNGLAPNPFFDICTLAICTPNHMRARLSSGDYIIGTASDQISKRHGWDTRRVVYVMMVDKVMDLDIYYHEHPEKRGNSSGSEIDKVGDAIYRNDDNGVLYHVPESEEHLGLEHQDIRGNRVFLGRTFWHFGSKSPTLPDENWAHTIPHSFRGIRYIYDTETPQNRTWSDAEHDKFLAWLKNFEKGLIGMPADMPDMEQSNSHRSCS